MKDWWKYLGGILIGAIAGYYLTIALMPNVIYAGAKKKILSRPGYEINKLSVSPIVNATSRAVVMPNPDFIYLTAFYDLSDGPLKLWGYMPDSTYWSVAMYHPNTVNWYVKNDQQYNTNSIDLKLNFEDGTISKPGRNSIMSKKKKGFLLIRVLITDRTKEKVAEYQEILGKVKLESF